MPGDLDGACLPCSQPKKGSVAGNKAASIASLNELLLQLDLDSQEVLAADNINLFLDTVDEALRDREYKDFNDSLNTKVKLNLYKSFCKEIEFKNYLQGVGDPGTRLLFKFRSGTNGLNEELGRHRGKNDDRQCKLCRGECESVVHVLWECPAYDSIRNNFMVELENLLGGGLGSLVHLIILIRQVLF